MVVYDSVFRWLFVLFRFKNFAVRICRLCEIRKQIYLQWNAGIRFSVFILVHYVPHPSHHIQSVYNSFCARLISFLVFYTLYLFSENMDVSVSQNRRFISFNFILLFCRTVSGTDCESNAKNDSSCYFFAILFFVVSNPFRMCFMFHYENVWVTIFVLFCLSISFFMPPMLWYVHLCFVSIIIDDLFWFVVCCLLAVCTIDLTECSKYLRIFFSLCFRYLIWHFAWQISIHQWKNPYYCI